ncbi:unnamed protein product [Closterium sp. Yama58-4]|nr:unnamed protein product [Closterium sp. Yama58-4]
MKSDTKHIITLWSHGLYASGYHNGYGSAPYGSLQASVAAGGGRKAAMATAAAAATSSLAAVRVFKGNSVLAQFKARITARFAEGPAVLLADSAERQGAAGAEALRARGIEATCEIGERGEAERVAVESGADGATQAVVVGGLGCGEEQSAAVRMAQAVLLPALGAVSHAFMHGLNRTEVIDAHKLTDAIAHRPPGTPLLTVANHVAAMDDPLVMAAVVPPSLMLARPAALRWTLCASDRCFSSPLLSAFFTSLRALPVERGGGLKQPGMVAAAQRLSEGGWVHIFPEGTRSLDGGRTLGPMRRGVAWLAAQCLVPPLIIPVVHVGMHRVQARGQTLPATGQQRLHSHLLARESHLLEAGAALEGALPRDESLAVEGCVAGVEADRELAALMCGTGVMDATDCCSDVSAATSTHVSLESRADGKAEGGGWELSQPNHPHWQIHPTGSRVSHWPLTLAAHPLTCLEDRTWPSLALASHMADASPSAVSSSSRGAAGLLHSQWAKEAAAVAAAAREAVARQQEIERVALLFGFAARCAVGGGQWQHRQALMM